ncbi:MAG: type II toxin-antitoxin system VapC family toxin [Formosimonas sp.]
MTKRFVMLDNDMLVDAFTPSPDTDIQKVGSSKSTVEALLEDSNVQLAITPLILYEFLRNPKSTKTQEELLAILNDFEQFEITRDVSVRAADIYVASVHQRNEDSQSPTLDKRQFDLLHYVVAEQNELEFITANTKDKERIERIIERMNEVKQNAS